MSEGVEWCRVVSARTRVFRDVSRRRIERGRVIKDESVMFVRVIACIE
jgi:hypothetical protein